MSFASASHERNCWSSGVQFSAFAVCCGRILNASPAGKTEHGGLKVQQSRKVFRIDAEVDGSDSYEGA